MSIQTFTHMPTGTWRGELVLINPNERRHDGHFELINPERKSSRKIHLYFAYDAVITPAQLSEDEVRKEMFAELVEFYNTLQFFGSFKPYVLGSIHLIRGEPLIVLE